MHQKYFFCNESGPISIVLQVEIKHSVTSSITGHNKNDKTFIGSDTFPEDKWLRQP